MWRNGLVERMNWVERAVAGKPEHKVDVVLLAEIHHFRAAVVTIATQGDSGSRPVPADVAYEPAQMASDLLTGRCLAGAQQHRQRPAGRDVVDTDGHDQDLARYIVSA